MPTPNSDRRFQRTEQLLGDALVTLILEKGYDAITIQDIIDRANVGRSTFYAHYQDKQDLLLSGFQALFDDFQHEYTRTAASGKDPVQMAKELSLYFFRHTGAHRELFTAMIGEQGGKIIQEHTQKYLVGFISDLLRKVAEVHREDLTIEIVANTIAGSYLTMLVWWLDRNLPCPAEEINALFLQLVTPGVQDVLAAGL
jgi:AcrR family transcriptional regulator